MRLTLVGAKVKGDRTCCPERDKSHDGGMHIRKASLREASSCEVCPAFSRGVEDPEGKNLGCPANARKFEDADEVIDRSAPMLESYVCLG